MEGYIDGLDAAVRVQEVHLVQLYLRVVECDVVQSHHAVLWTQHATPLTDVECGNSRSLLHRPNLMERDLTQ